MGINAEKTPDLAPWWNLSISAASWLPSGRDIHLQFHLHQCPSSSEAGCQHNPAFCPEKTHTFLLETPPSHHPTFLDAPIPPKSTSKESLPQLCKFPGGWRGMQGGICAGKVQFAVLGAGLAEEGRIPALRSSSPRWHRPWVGCLDQVHQLHFTDSHSQTWALHGKYFASELK